MKTRVITGIVFAFAVAAFVLPGFLIPQITLFFFFLVAAISIIEVSAVAKTKFGGINQAACVLGSLGVFIPLITVFIHGDLNWRVVDRLLVSSPNRLQAERELIVKYVTESLTLLFAFLILLSFSVIFYVILTKGPDYLMDSLMVPLIIIYISVPVVCSQILLYMIPNGFMWIIAAMIVSWVSDVFAYFAGVTLGRHKIIPLISPKKTWEGSIGGVFGSVFIMVIWMIIMMSGPDIVKKSVVYMISFGIIMGLLAGIASQLGDWFASSIKRWGDVKDFGNFLPGHGGLMDRFDGVFFAFPVVLTGALIYYLV